MSKQKSTFAKFFSDFFPWKKEKNEIITSLILKGIKFVVLLTTTIIALNKYAGDDDVWMKRLFMGWWLIPFALGVLKKFLDKADKATSYTEINVSTGQVSQKTSLFGFLLICILLFIIGSAICMLPEVLTPIYLVLVGIQAILHIFALIKKK